MVVLVGCAVLLCGTGCRSTPDPVPGPPKPTQPPSARVQPDPPAYTPKPGRTVVSTTPEQKPLWYRDYAAWIEKQTRSRAKRFIMAAGEGRNESSARRDVLYEAAAALGLTSVDLPNLKPADTPYVVEYSDGSYKVTAVYVYEAPYTKAADVPKSAPLSFDGGVAKLCDDLLDQMAKEKKGGIEVLGVGEFGYKTTPFPCEFSDFLETELRRGLKERVGRRIKVLDPAIMKSETVPITPDASVVGKYWPGAKPRTVRVQARMTDLTSGNLLAEAAVDLALEKMRVRTEPIKVGQAEKNLAAANHLREKVKQYATGAKNFRISLWLPRGRRAWRKGEKLVFRFQSERDCYLNLLHFDSAGAVQLLFPNQWHQDAFVKGGRAYAIPGKDMNFELEVDEPYGTDIVLAIATTVRTKDLYGFRQGKDEGFRSIEGGTRGIRVKPSQEIANLPGEKKAEALLALTTIP